MEPKSSLNSLKTLVSVLKMADQENLTRSDFTEALRRVLDYLKKQEAERTAKIQKLEQVLESARNELKNQNDSTLQSTVSSLEANLATAKAEIANQRNEIIKKLNEVRDGKDADEDAILERAIERVKEELFIPTAEDLMNDVPSLATRIRDALELLQGDERLDVSAIKGIEELLNQLDGKIKQAVGAIHVPSPVGWTRHQSIALSSGTTVYSLDQAPGHQGKAAIVRYEGQVLTETTHYSISGTDVTLTFDPNDSTKLDVTFWPY